VPGSIEAIRPFISSKRQSVSAIAGPICAAFAIGHEARRLKRDDPKRQSRRVDVRLPDIRQVV